MTFLLRVGGLSIIFLLVIFSSVSSADQTDRFNVVVSRPALDPALFQYVESSDFLGQMGWGLGSDISYAWRSIDVGRAGGTRTHSGLNHLIVQHFRGDLGITDWFTIGLDMPMAWLYQFSDPTKVSAPYETHTAASDLRLSMKVPIVDRKKHGVGFAWADWLTFPTGKTSHFLGEDYPTVCGMIIVDGSPSPWVDLGFNIGYISRKHVVINDVNFDDQLMAAAAANINVTPKLHLITEFETRTPVTEFFKSRKNTPATVRQSARWNIRENWFLEGGGEFGIIHGVGAPWIGGYLGFRYTVPTHVTKAAAEEAQPPSPPPRPFPPPVPQYVPPPPAPSPPPAKYISPPPSPPPSPQPYVPTPMFEIPGTIRAWAELKATILFPLGSGALTEEAKTQLRKVADVIGQDKSVIGVRFEGFVANVAGEAGNSTLAWERALNAQRYFATMVSGKFDIQSNAFWSPYHLTGLPPSQDARAYIWILHTFNK